MAGFTDYMNKSLIFRKALTSYCINKEKEAQETRLHLNMLDKFDVISENDEGFRKRALDWFNNKTKTIELRELSLIAGYDYWKDLTNSNIIDTFDSANIND